MDTTHLSKKLLIYLVIVIVAKAIAVGLGLDPNEDWKQVRTDYILELDMHRDHYAWVFGGHNAIDSLWKRLDHYSSPTEQGNKYWMLMPKIGYIIANFYKMVIVYLSKQPTCTAMSIFLPQISSPSFQTSQVPKFLVISYLFSRKREYFMSVKLKDFTPIRTPTTFSTKFRATCAIGWEDPIHVRTEAYRRHFAEKFATTDRTEVIPLYFSDSD